jgi:hypothetical protein
MSFRTFKLFLPAEPGQGNKHAGAANKPEEKDSKIHMESHTASSMIRGRITVALDVVFYVLNEVVIFNRVTITRAELYNRIENAVLERGLGWSQSGLNKAHIQAILNRNKAFLKKEELWGKRKTDDRDVLKELWHSCIQYRKRWNALKLRELTKKDRLIDSWENFLIYVYAPYFWKNPEFLSEVNYYEYISSRDWSDATTDDLDSMQTTVDSMQTMLKGSQQKVELMKKGNEVTQFIIRQIDRRLPEWQIDPDLKPHIQDFVYMNWKILTPCFEHFMRKHAKNPIESREGDLLTQQMKHLVAVLDRSNTSYIDNDESKKLEILGYGIVNDVLIIDGKLKISTCFVTGKPSNGVGDHLYPILNAWKITGRCGSNSPWNLLPVISSINKGYTRINIQDIEGGKHTAVDLEVTKVTRVYTTDHPEGLPVDEFMSRITGANYNEKKGLINYVDMEELILSEKEEWTEPPSPGICILKPPQREKKQHKQVLIVPKEQLVLLGIKEEWSSNYVLSEPLDIWMKVYLWRKYVKEERTANLSYSVSPEVHKNLLGVLRSSFMSIAEGTQKIIELRAFAQNDQILDE